MDAAPRRRLRWYQYSLRSLFVLMALVAVAGSWFTWKKMQVESQRAAVRWIGEMNGMVWYDYQHNPVPARTTPPEPPGPAWLRAWLGDDFFAHVEMMRIDDGRVTDADLEQLNALSQLKYVDLECPRVTDAGLERLKKLTQLTDLSLYETRVTDAGLEHLQGLAQLRRVDLGGTKVSPEGVKKLQQALPNCTIGR